MTATTTRTWQNKTQLMSKKIAQRVRFKTLQNDNVKLPEFAWTDNRNPDGKLINFISATQHHKLLC